MQHQFGVTALVNQNDSLAFKKKMNEDGYAVISFEGSAIHSKKELFSAIQKALPASEDASEIVKWAGLNDALWNAVFDLESERVMLIWENSENILTAGLDDFITACDLFICLARDLHSKGVGFTLVLMGYGNSFPPISTMNLV